MSERIQDLQALVERLRACANGVGSFKTAQGDYGLCGQAADALAREHLRRQRAEEALREALDLFDADGFLFCSGDHQVRTITRLRRALALSNNQPEEPANG